MVTQTNALTPNASAPRDYGHLQRFMDHARLQPGKGGEPAWFKVLPRGPQILFWINPQSYQEQAQSLFQEIPTLTGVVRLNFGEQPVSITLEGTTGIAGWDAGPYGGMADLDRLKPQSGATDVHVAFHFPYQFSGPRYCFINQFAQETRPEAPLYYFYRIELVCYDIVATESPSYVITDPSGPSGRVTDCHFSSLGLPWTNPQHPPGFVFRKDASGSFSATVEEAVDALYPLTPCTPKRPKPKPKPPAPKPKPPPQRAGRRTGSLIEV